MNGRVALVTCASIGIGKATAVGARRKEELASLVTAIEAGGGKLTAVRTDVSEAKDVERMVAHAIETFGRRYSHAIRPGTSPQARPLRG